MGLQTAPGYVSQNADTSPFQHPVELDRNMAEALFGRSGATRYGGWALTPTGVNQQLSIATGSGFVNGIESAQQGGYFCWSDAAETKTFGAPSGSPRIDTLLLRVWDPQYGTLPSGTARAQWDIVAGTPAATPTALADSVFTSPGASWVPGAWMKWAEVRINPGDTTIPAGQIYTPGTVVSGTGTTWGGRYSRVPGGVTLCLSTSRPTDAVLGDRLYELDTKFSYTHNGTKFLRDEVVVHATTSKNYLSTTTLADIDNIAAMSLEANCTYVFEYTLYMLSDASVDSKFAMRLPASATIRWSPNPSQGGGETGLQSSNWFGSYTAVNPGIVAGTVGQDQSLAIRGTIFNAGTAGTASVQAAPNINTGSFNLTFYLGSSLRYRQVA